MNTAVIGLGSNIEPKKHIKDALRLLREKFIVLGESRFVQTKPVGYPDQSDFINGSVLIETPLDFNQINQVLKALETQMGRRPSLIKFGPRIIDLDIIVYNNTVSDQDFYERDFVRESTLELIPNLPYK